MKTAYNATFSTDEKMIPHIEKALKKLGIEDFQFSVIPDIPYRQICTLDDALEWLEKHVSQEFIHWVNKLPTRIPKFTKNSEYLLWDRMGSKIERENLLCELAMDAVTAGSKEDQDNPFMVAVWLCYKAKNPEGSPVPLGREEDFSMEMLTLLMDECEGAGEKEAS